ncbi:glycerol-3-phosphate dehydrogenase subunit B [Halalkaliarchaeum desulfuricum]|uniref:Glycerol-3-phosphate dehydrogenase subunit B n=1 Tax=Halalkaliarchaeum desulfuricum TaxID=2055893 RepID=A0A343TLY5_9EURY|nr:glycerol-3-phosphate dehydrogenase subunit GlpB [Halalkaliarchaeum desulfuricum]AUX10107.1 glycerol-3-phosphate dehydrogenase subunit B [Halalkaliarchaeum desulfuricum]
MALESDVLVIGGGLAGTTAAIAATREGADVRLVSYKKSTLRQSSGLIDALGYVPERDGDSVDSERDGDSVDSGSGTALRGPIVDPFGAIDDLPEEHPYSVVGADAVEAGFALFDDLVGDAYRGGHTDTNALFPTFGGTIKPTARYPAATAAGVASDDRPMFVVGFRSLTAYDAGALADGLSSSGVPFPVSGAEVEFAAAFRDDAKITRFARALDDDEPIEGVPARKALAAAVEPHLSEFTDSVADTAEIRVGFPAFLGEDRAADVREELGDRLGAAVFEIPMGPPNLPGLRLEALLLEELDAAGVSFETGVKAVDRTVGADGAVEAVLVDRNGTRVPYAADAVVLATGGLIGKGLQSDRKRVTEPVFDCPVSHPADRYDWFVDDAFGGHPFARFGLATDDRLRPVDPTGNGDPEYPNLFAAGAVLGGADVAREKSASGVSLATGVVAGRGAAAVANDTLEANR